MSGIGGIMVKEGKPSDPQLFKIADSLQHRGPDAMTGEVYDTVGLVHTRLSIIDREGGSQPLHGDKFALVANGSIVNYIELRSAFPDYPYETQSDFESIFPLYDKYGAQFVDHLRGSYAIALYDSSTKTLFLSRDPFGIKSLYYMEGSNFIYFASEAQALVNACAKPPLVNQEKLESLLAQDYTWGRETLYKNIYRVLPGETLVIRGGKICERLLRTALPKGPPHAFSRADGLTAIDKVLDRSVAVHMRSDVPIGVFLSGGLNTTCLLKMMSKHIDDPIPSFSIATEGNEKERSNQVELAKALKTEHQEVTFDEKDFWTLLPRVMAALDDPCLDLYSLALYKMAGEASKSVKVIMTGEGGNEIFGGYNRYQTSLKRGWLSKFLHKEVTAKSLGLLRNPAEELIKEDEEFIPVLKAQSFSPLQIAQALDFEAFLPNDRLLRLDRCLMAHGIEGRTPYLDLAVADAFFNMPDDMKIKKGETQWILRQWLERSFPDVLPFLKHDPFTLPYGEWIEAKGKDLGYLVSKQEGMEEIFHPDKIQRIFMSQKKEVQKMALSLLCLSLWHQIHILKLPAQEDVMSTLGKPFF